MQSSGFFFSTPSDEPEREPEQFVPPAWLQPPTDVLPGRVVIDELVHRDEATVLWFREVGVYEEGLSVSLRWIRRRRGEAWRDWDALMHSAMRYGPGTPDPDGLHLGVQLADGRRVMPFDRAAAFRPDASEPEPPTLLMFGGGGGGGADQYEGNIDAWLWSPGSVPGPFEVVLEWREMGIPELRHEITAEILDRAPRPRPIWP